MDEQTIARLEQLLQDTLEVAEENNALLLAMQRRARWALFGKIVIWIILLGVPLLFLGPLLHTILPYSANEPKTIFGLPSPAQLQEIISTYQASGTAVQQ